MLAQYVFVDFGNGIFKLSILRINLVEVLFFLFFQLVFYAQVYGCFETAPGGAFLSAGVFMVIADGARLLHLRHQCHKFFTYIFFSFTITVLYYKL